MNTWLLVGIYYALTLFFTVLIGGTQQGVGFTTPETVILPQLAPDLAALCMLLFFKIANLAFSLQLIGKNIPLTAFARHRVRLQIANAVFNVGVGVCRKETRIRCS